MWDPYVFMQRLKLARDVAKILLRGDETGGLGDGSPPAGSRGRAPVGSGGFAPKPPDPGDIYWMHAGLLTEKISKNIRHKEN